MMLARMLARHASRHLAAYSDGQLEADRRRAVEAHLAGCARCRSELDEIRFAAGLVRQLSDVTAPASIWTAVDRALDAPAPQTTGTWTMPALRWAFASLMVAAIGSAALWYANRPADGTWEVNRPDGRTTRMATGEWIETTPASRARIKVGEIGTVDVEPETRVRLGTLLPSEYRIALERGTISATIVAPPRFFFVDTPSSTVVDLGCAYTMQVREDGGGELRMTQGWAALEWNGRESLVPAGAICITRRGVGPGTPYFEDASPALQQALAAFDFANGGASAVSIVIAESRVRDTLTLWHLLSRVESGDRARVYDRIAELAPVPDGVTREKALQLDPETLKRWREELAWTW